MPASARIRTVVFQSLLLPPLRVQLRTLHSFVHPPCTPIALHRARPAATCFVQRRSVHLYKTAKAKTALGMHKVLDFDRYQVEPPSASDHRVNLVKSEKDPTVIAEDLSLQELYDKHVSPGNFLYLTDPIPKKLCEQYKQLISDEKMPAERNNYGMAKARTMEKVAMKTPQTDRWQLGALKNVILLPSNPVEYTKLALDRAYQFIEFGSPVEVRIRLFGTKNRDDSRSAGAWRWMHKHFPHLRPDFICKSMPEGTGFLIKPVTDGRTVQFVLGRQAEQMGKLDLTTRLFRVKAAVEASLPRNPMALRYIYKTQKRRGLAGLDEGDQPAKMPNDSEEAEQERVLAAARSGSGGRLHLNAGVSIARTESPSEAMGSIGLGLPGSKKQKTQYGKGKAKNPKQRAAWQGRGTGKSR